MNRFISISFLSVIALTFVALGTAIACGGEDSDEAASPRIYDPGKNLTIEDYRQLVSKNQKHTTLRD